MAAGERVVVLGGGPCGLYAALELARAGRAVTVLEKEEVPGGLARGHRRGANFYDLGVHMFHAFDPEVFETIREVMGEERIEVALDARIKWAGALFRYPLQFRDIVAGMPPLRLLRCCAGLLLTQARYTLFPREPANAEEALIQLYGRPLYEFFFRDFTARYWGFPPTEMSATFVKTKMPRLTAVDVLWKLAGMVGIRPRGVSATPSALREETLHYSRTGAETMPRRLAAAVEAAGGEVVCGAGVTGIEVDEAAGRVVAVRAGDRRYEADAVLSTIPLRCLVEGMGEVVPGPVREAAGALGSRSLAVFGLLVAKERALEGIYVYHRDRIFHRVGEPKNAGVRVDPPDHTLLVVETTCEVGDARWRGAEEVRARILADLEAEGICRPEEVVEMHLLQAEHGYPVFSLGFEEPLETVRGFLAGFGNLRSTGRQGGYCYPNMHRAMRMGADAAREILEEAP